MIMTEQRPNMRQVETKASPAPASAADAPIVRKRRILWIAVGGMTVLIAIFWVLLLPLQIREWKFGSMSDLAERWRVVRDENLPPTSFRETLNRIHDRLVKSSAKGQGAALTAPNAAAPAMDIARLRAKLEQISENTLIAPENAAPKKAQGTK